MTEYFWTTWHKHERINNPENVQNKLVSISFMLIFHCEFINCLQTFGFRPYLHNKVGHSVVHTTYAWLLIIKYGVIPQKVKLILSYYTRKYV